MIYSKIKLFKFFTLAILLFLLSGCAYFNMFFNGRKHYEKGEESYRSTDRVNRSDYENSLVELSKILEFYPDNSIVPDALLMMGKCYFRLGDNIKAKRKFQELIANYKESDLVQEAKLRLVEVAISEGAFDLANTMISEIKMDKVDLEASELKQLLANLSLAKNDTVQAYKLYGEAAEITSDKKWQRIYLKKAADLSEKSCNYRSSSNYYNKLAELAEDRKTKYDNSLLYADMLEKAGVADSAFAIYENLLANEEYEQYSLSVQLRVGRWYFLQKKYAESFEKLDEIIRVLEKKPENSAIIAEAAFWLGEYYLVYKQDLKNAGKMYDSVKVLNNNQELQFSKRNLKRSNSLSNYKQYSNFCSNYKFMQDSLQRDISSINKSILENDSKKDSVKIKNYKIDLATKQKDLRKLNIDFVKNKYLLGELFSKELLYPDSAKLHYSQIIYRLDQPYYASRSLLELANLEQIKITPRYNLLMDSLILLYPSTIPSNFARDVKGLEKITIVEDSVTYFFNLASDGIISGNYALADEYYNKALRQNEESPLQPVISLAAGLINEKYLNNFESAKQHYLFLKNNYSQTKEGILAVNKLRPPGEITTVATSQVNQDKKPEKTEIPDTEKWFLMDRRNK